MKLQTQVPLVKAVKPIDYKSELVLLGSCFSQYIGAKFQHYKFKLSSNPFGILFHPLAIKKILERVLSGNKYTEEDIFFLNEQWHCFEVHSELSNSSKEGLLRQLNEQLVLSAERLKNATHICITLGTAWVYRTKGNGQIVANCHKVPQASFTKEILAVSTIEQCLLDLILAIRKVNPAVQFIFTVSPVRHLKDGFVENQQSKAHLISAIHSTVNTGKAFYFPSYEIMMDELRDYRFYEADMVHPSAMAIDYIWEKFSEVWIANEAKAVMDKVGEIQKAIQHRPFNPTSKSHEKVIKSIQTKIAYITKAYPFMDFNFPKA